MWCLGRSTWLTQFLKTGRNDAIALGLFWILLVLSPLPDEGEKTQSAPGGNHRSVVRNVLSRVLLLSLVPWLALAFSLVEG